MSAAAPTIQYLQLDAGYDPLFDTTANLTDLDAVTQAINTRLRLFLGEWWENLAIGLPVFQSILGSLGSAQNLTANQLTIQRNIEGAPYVTAVPNVSLDFTDGQLAVQYTAQTQFGTVSSTVSAPALLTASLEV